MHLFMSFFCNVFAEVWKLYLILVILKFPTVQCEGRGWDPGLWAAMDWSMDWTFGGWVSCSQSWAAASQGDRRQAQEKWSLGDGENMRKGGNASRNIYLVWLEGWEDCALSHVNWVRTRSQLLDCSVDTGLGQPVSPPRPGPSCAHHWRHCLLLLSSAQSRTSSTVIHYSDQWAEHRPETRLTGPHQLGSTQSFPWIQGLDWLVVSVAPLPLQSCLQRAAALPQQVGADSTPHDTYFYLQTTRQFLMSHVPWQYTCSKIRRWYKTILIKFLKDLIHYRLFMSLLILALLFLLYQFNCMTFVEWFGLKDNDYIHVQFVCYLKSGPSVLTNKVLSII